MRFGRSSDMYVMFPDSIQGRLRYLVLPQEINLTHSHILLPLSYRYRKRSPLIVSVSCCCSYKCIYMLLLCCLYRDLMLRTPKVFIFCDSYERCFCVCVCACHPEHEPNDSIPLPPDFKSTHAQHIKQRYYSSSSGTTSSSNLT